MPAPGHKNDQVTSVVCAVLTVSDTRTAETDKSGQLIRELVTTAGHTIHAYSLLKDDPPVIREALVRWRDDPGCQAVLITGGTGLAARDTTYEVVDGLLEKRLDGFGELFRARSYDQIGAAAMLSRAVGGAMATTAVFAMPGSTAAVRLAMTDLILPELRHVVHLLATRR